KRLAGDCLGRPDLAVVDRLLQVGEVELLEVLAEHVVEAALGHTAMQRGLAAFEAVERHAGARGLALAAAARGLAEAGADTAAQPLEGVPGAGVVANFVELHLANPE